MSGKTKNLNGMVRSVMCHGSARGATSYNPCGESGGYDKEKDKAGGV